MHWGQNRSHITVVNNNGIVIPLFALYIIISVINEIFVSIDKKHQMNLP